jgi:long-chain acyl-CoA synthetase
MADRRHGHLAAAAVNVPPHAPLARPTGAVPARGLSARWLFVSTREQAEVRQAGELPDLAGVVAFDRAAVGDGVLSWDGFVQRGRCAPGHGGGTATARAEPGAGRPGNGDVHVRHNGNPKGVMLTHANLLTNATAMSALTAAAGRRRAHLAAVQSHLRPHGGPYRALIAGTLLVLAESPEMLVQNLGEIEPTHISSVPRFYEKVLAAVASSDPAETGRRLRDVFGRRIAWLNSGGAPLAMPVADAYREAGLLILQGYGLTETAPVISFNRHESYKQASVGRPLPGVEVRIAPDGEVLTRGPHVMKGYWNNPTATAETIRDGWLHTGDLGTLDSGGFLTITGRKKELLVLSNGKKNGAGVPRRADNCRSLFRSGSGLRRGAHLPDGVEQLNWANAQGAALVRRRGPELLADCRRSGSSSRGVSTPPATCPTGRR